MILSELFHLTIEGIHIISPAAVKKDERWTNASFAVIDLYWTYVGQQGRRVQGDERHRINVLQAASLQIVVVRRMRLLPAVTLVPWQGARDRLAACRTALLRQLPVEC